MKASIFIAKSLIAIVMGLAATAIYLIDVNHRTTNAIAGAVQYDRAWSCVQAKVEVANLGQAVGRYSADQSPGSLRHLRIQNEIVAGRAESLSSGSFIELKKTQKFFAVRVADYSGIARELELNLMAWVETGSWSRIHGKLAQLQNKLEPLCSFLQQQNAEAIEHSQETLQAAHQATVALMVGLIGAGFTLITMLAIQNRIAVQAFARQREISDQHVYAANHDTLTGLPNRAAFFRSLEQHLQKVRSDSMVAVLTIDLDRFKLVNDTLGHQVGDKLLKLVSQRLADLQACNVVTYVARLGGDEFIALVSCDDTIGTAVSAADAIIESVRAPYLLDGHSIIINATVGIAISEQDCLMSMELARRSDVALNHAKARERGTLSVYSQNMDERLRDRRALEIDMRGAIERGEFEVHYQPFVNLESGEICGVEALMRWHHPTRGTISPAKFIPIAEESGLIVDMGSFALRQTCRDALLMPRSWTVAVNLSAVQFLRNDLFQSVREALDTTGLDPRRLELEITESLMIGDERKVGELLDALQSLGIKVALDDFGTGYSSLSYLRSYGFQKMKIDRSFVEAATEDSEGLALLRSIVGLGHALGLAITAEGVENSAQCRALREIGCTYGQGYLFARPMPIAELLQHCTTNAAAKEVFAA